MIFLWEYESDVYLLITVLTFWYDCAFCFTLYFIDIIKGRPKEISLFLSNTKIV